MQNIFNEKWNELYKNATKPWTELAELNINTFNKFVKNYENIEQIAHTKKPEDFLSMQTKLAQETFLETMKYSQEVCRIWLEAVSQNNEAITDIVRETTNKTAESIKSNYRNRE